MAGDGDGVEELTGMGGGGVLLEDDFEKVIDEDVELPEWAEVDVDPGIHHRCARGHADRAVGGIMPGLEGIGEGGELGEAIDSGGGAGERGDAHAGKIGGGEGDDVGGEGGIDDALVIADEAGMEEEEAVGPGTGMPGVVDGAEAVEEVIGLAGGAVSELDELGAGIGV